MTLGVRNPRFRSLGKLFSSLFFKFFLFFYSSTAYGLSDANAYILVFDLLCPDSFDYVSGMYSQIADGRNLSRIPVVNSSSNIFVYIFTAVCLPNKMNYIHIFLGCRG